MSILNITYGISNNFKITMTNLFFSFLPKIKGMAYLVNAFEAKPFPSGGEIRKTTIQVGTIRYRNCASFLIEKNGLYLKVKFIFRNYPAIFIPSTSIKETQPARLYGLSAIKFIFNDPNIPPVIFYEKDLKENNFYLR
jgi:hypothetical protein